MQLTYLAYQRLPTARANGYQITKMCTAFAGAGLDVTLLHPRFHYSPQGPAEALFEAYNLPPGIFRQMPFETLASRLRLHHGSAVVFRANQESIAWTHRRYVARHVGPGDIVFTRDWRNLAALARLRDRIGFRLVCELHSLPASAVQQRIADISRADLVVIISEALKQGFIELGLPPERAHVAHDAFDLREFATPPSRAEARQALGLGDDFMVGFLGSFSHMAGDKGTGALIEVLAELADLPNLSLHLVGSIDADREHLPLAEQAAPLYQHAAAMGIAPERFGIHGRCDRTQVPLWLSAFDVCTNPLPDNRHNRMASPLKIFEYMAARRPIVVTDLAGTAEVLKHERNALLVPSGDTPALAAALRRLHDDPALAQRLADQARVDVEQYTWERRVAGILERLGVPAAAAS